MMQLISSVPGVRFSEHSRKRMQQRGMSVEDVTEILMEGHEFCAPGSASIYLIPTRAIEVRICLLKAKSKTLSPEIQKRLRRLMNIRNKAVVVSHEGTIITVERRHKRFANAA